MDKQSKQKKGQKGQAAIEFMAVVVVTFFFLLFFLSLAIVLVASDYVDYATFMTARTYKTGSSSEDIQRRNANIVWESYTNFLFPEVLRSRGIDFKAVDEANVRTSGVLTSYTIDLFYLPPLFAGDSAPSRITLNAEAHLGRDPTFEECQGFFQDFVGSLPGANPDQASLMEDNGC